MTLSSDHCHGNIN